MENQNLQDLEKIFKAGGDAVCLPNTKPQTLTEFLDKNEDLALRLGAVIQSVCCCINWHPSVKTDEGKKAVCSNCNRPRHAVVQHKAKSRPFLRWLLATVMK